jgi:zinc/manganese transport system substrate-binding protein
LTAWLPFPRQLRLLAAIAGSLPGLAAAGAASPAPLRIVALSPVLAEIAREVGGPAVSVTGLLPPGVDPHTFEPAPADMLALVDADLVLASGLGLEAYLDKLAANSGTHARIVAVGDLLRDPLVTSGAQGRHEPDPHWWNSIAATREATRDIAEELARLRPESAADFSRRTAGRLARLDALAAWARRELAPLPPDRRQLVTSHDAFGWFARDYGFTVHPIAGLSPDAEPNARDVAQLSDLIRRLGIPAVFLENSEGSKLAAALAREAGVRLGGTLYPDGLVPEADGATYEAMFRHNVRTIVAALR